MNGHRILVVAAVGLCTALWTYGCGDGATEPQAPAPDPPRPATVTVTPATVRLTAFGATEQLAAEVRDQNGNAMAGAAVSWASSAAAVATVNASGLVTAIANGTATITATAGSASGSATVAVAQEVSALAVSPAEATITALGDTLWLGAEAFDANGRAVAGAEFSWESSDDAVATVDGSGLVTAMGNGTATITATAGSASGSATVAVAQEVSALAVSPAEATITALSDTLWLGAEAFDANGRAVAGAEFSWESSDDAVATVDGSGLVTAMGNGTATITATTGSASGAATVTVAQAPDSVAVSPAEATIAALGDTLRLGAEAFDANGRAVAGAEFSWESSDDAVATVDGSGLVTAAGNGTATITATVGDVGGESIVTVVQPSLVQIPDRNLRAAIEAALGKRGGQPIYDTEMQTLTSLDAEGPGRVGGGIRDLTGLEHARNLRELVLHSNTIADLGPLRALAKLQRLDLHAINHYYDDPQPPLDYSPLAGLSELTWLDVGYNYTPDISPLAELRKLEHLNGVNNRIADVSPLAALTSLRVAILANNDISDLGPLANNPGLGEGSEVDVRANPLSRVSIGDHVPMLQARGATVLFDDLIVFSEPEIYNGDLFVLPVDESLAAGRGSSLDWTRRFYEHFDDDFDFLVFVVNLYHGDYDNPDSAPSYFVSTHNDVRGVGRPISSDNRWPHGLQGVVVHGVVSFSVDSRSIIHTGPMLHELMHRWANSVTPSSGSGRHWGFSSANGTLGGFDIADLVDHGGGAIRPEALRRTGWPPTTSPTAQSNCTWRDSCRRRKCPTCGSRRTGSGSTKPAGIRCSRRVGSGLMQSRTSLECTVSVCPTTPSPSARSARQRFYWSTITTRSPVGI